MFFQYNNGIQFISAAIQEHCNKMAVRLIRAENLRLNLYTLGLVVRTITFVSHKPATVSECSHEAASHRALL